MTGREWQPGDILRNPDGSRGIVAMRGRGCGKHIMAHDELHIQYEDGDWDRIDAADECRSLAVIDPDSTEEMERLAAAWEAVVESGPLPDQPMTMAALRMRAALREFASPMPTKPDEPGTWGVVEASCVHSARRLHWMLHEDGNWWPFAPYGEDDRRPLPDDWDSLVDPVVVRDGVAGEPS